MDISIIIIVIIAAIVTIPSVLFLIYVFGGIFRQWNEGSKYNDQNTKDVLKTLAIGLVIFAIFGFLLVKCGILD